MRDASAPVQVVHELFVCLNERDYDGALELIHPEVEASLKALPGEVVHGIDALERFFRDVAAERTVFELTVSEVTALDERRVIAQGRMRWTDEERVLRDDPVVWALELEEGLLRRSRAVRTLADAEALLAAAPREGRA